MSKQFSGCLFPSTQGSLKTCLQTSAKPKLQRISIFRLPQPTE
nr:hypothetical protein [uncultured Kingella sp.]